MKRQSIMIAGALGAGMFSLAAGSEPAGDTAESLRLDFTAIPIAAAEPARRADMEEQIAPAMLARVPFGQAGTWRWNIQGGFGVDFDDTENRFGLGGISFSYFTKENFSVEFEFNGLYFDQDTVENATGLNFNLLLRWHFMIRESWSLYTDGGAGVMETNHAVPPGGSTFNFTPQSGFGVSFDIGEEARMLTGIRWHHISNGRTFDSNPAQDAVFVYAALSFPF